MGCKVGKHMNKWYCKSVFNFFSFGLNSINVFNITGSFGYDAINGRCEAIPLWPDCSLARSGTPQYMDQCKRMEGVAWYRRGVHIHGGQVIYFGIVQILEYTFNPFIQLDSGSLSLPFWSQPWSFGAKHTENICKSCLHQTLMSSTTWRGLSSLSSSATASSPSLSWWWSGLPSGILAWSIRSWSLGAATTFIGKINILNNNSKLFVL